MHVQEITRADRPRRCLSLRFDEAPSPDKKQLRTALPRTELRRIVAEMVG
jgi:hypothetical protein